jgi:hypothetical protein
VGHVVANNDQGVSIPGGDAQYHQGDIHPETCLRYQVFHEVSADGLGKFKDIGLLLVQ